MKKIDYYEICKLKLKYLNYSNNTCEIYLYYIKEFLNTIDNPSRLNSNDFQSYLDNYNFTSISKQNQVINAIRFLYKYGLEKKYDKVSFKRPKKEKHLPRIIDKDLLINSINNINNLKHKAIISLAYSGGLRVSEIVNLRIKDIDSKRMLIFIYNGKGRKDRYIPLSNYILDLLRLYFKEYKPIEYLFNGQYSSESCNQIVKKYIDKDYHFHLLRHSCFTHLIESGTDCRVIQKIAGHSNIKTTEGYMQVSTNVLNKVIMPL